MGTESVSEPRLPPEDLVAVVGTRQGQQRPHGLFGAVVAQAEALVVEHPRHRAFDDVAVVADLVLTVHSAAGDADLDAQTVQRCPAASVVVALVGVQLVRPAPRPSTAGPLDRGSGLQQRIEQHAVVSVGCRQQHRQRNAERGQ
jgi:hypothetical protein